MFRRRGEGVQGAAFEHFCCPLSVEFDRKFCATLRTFEFNRAEYWVVNSCSRVRHLGKLKSKIGKCVTMACIYYIFIMQYCYNVPSRIHYNVKVV